MNPENSPVIRKNNAAPMAPWTNRSAAGGGMAPAAHVPAGDAANEVNPWQRIRRLLRGRMWLAVTLAAICAIVGGGIGYKALKPEYRSDGMIEIRPILASPLGGNNDEQGLPMYSEYVQSQANILMSQRVVQAAMESDEWQALGRGNSPKAMEKFIKSLEVSYVDGSFLIRVSFTDPDPNAAQIAVKSMIQAYMSIYGDVESKELRDKMNMVDRDRQSRMQDRKAKEDQILQIAHDYGTVDLSTLHAALIDEVVRLESQLEQEQLALVAAQANAPRSMMSRKTGDEKQPVFTAQQIAAVDPIMQRYFQEVEADQDQIAQLQANGYGANHPLVRKAQADLSTTQARINTYAANYKPSPIASANGADSLALAGASIDQLKLQVDMLQQMYSQKRDAAAKVGNAFIQIKGLQNDVDQLKETVDQDTKLVDQYDAELKMNLTGRIKVTSFGDVPVTPATDRRQEVGLLGFLLGGACPVGVLMLVGLMDRRYRYSEDADGGMNLLGILPNLPDLLGDPKQASIAAHCVHQVRTMLQLRMHSEDSNLFAVTSAAPGDGKTSLTLALGLSFAASGSRTLLIDCDLVGAALSRRLGVNGEVGILQAMSAGRASEFCVATDIENLSILPAGNTDMHTAGSFSPSAIRKVMNEARKNYDIVLIDTGPVMGSIETSSVGAHADGVIIVVSRGQQRVLVERSVSQLRMVGARVLGIVFNRAEEADFERSVSRYSMRSIRPGQELATREKGPARSKAYGPVAGAVATSFTPGKDYDSDDV
ncbi:MAG TPA: AAA family ATPase [Tepidisphaeraceae bacterium]|jgi:capsular exopolysaccharide synthesis family protein